MNVGYTDKVACERDKSVVALQSIPQLAPGDAVHVQLYTYVAGGHQTDAVGVIPKRFIHTCSLCTVYMGTIDFRLNRVLRYTAQ